MRGHARSAFTRIEGIIAVTIVGAIAVLITIGIRNHRKVGSTRPGMSSLSKEKETLNLLGDISRNLEEYRQERGNYPRPADPEEETTIDGQTYRVGSAKMLYQVLSGDGTDAIKGGDTKMPNGQQGSATDPQDPNGPGKVYMDTVLAPTKQQISDKKQAKWVESIDGNRFYLVDPWRHPIQYQVRDAERGGSVSRTSMHTPSGFEVWSFGRLKETDESEEGMKGWITTWRR